MFEPLGIIGADAPIVCAIYAKKNGLLNEPGWKQFQRLAKREKKMLCMVKQAKLRSYRTAPIYKFGIQVPRNESEARKLDVENGNTRWRESEILELLQMDEYEMFRDLGKGAPIPAGYKKIRVHFVYDAKHDGRFKARLVADGHLTDTPVESVYSGVVSLRSLRLVVFVGELN